MARRLAVALGGACVLTWAALRAMREGAEQVRPVRCECATVPAWHGPADSSYLRAVAERYGVPIPLVWAIASVESGSAPQPGARGRHGEAGRLQVRRELWASRFRECSSDDETELVVCGVRILAWLRAQYGTWRAAVARYNATSQPALAEPYVRQVEARIGRMYLDGLR